MEDSGEPLRMLPPSSAELPMLLLRPFGGVPGGLPAPLPTFPCNMLDNNLQLQIGVHVNTHVAPTDILTAFASTSVCIEILLVRK